MRRCGIRHEGGILSIPNFTRNNNHVNNVAGKKIIQKEGGKAGYRDEIGKLKLEGTCLR